MALQKPFNINIRGATIDATENYELKWQVAGDIQSNYQVFIYANSNNSLIYSSEKISSYSTRFTIPVNTLTNGSEYKVKIKIWNEKDDTITSDAEVFQTSSRPTLMPNFGGTITSPSFRFEATYSQAENILLNSWEFFVYDDKQKLILTSGVQPHSELVYLVENLSSERDYYVEFRATSNFNMTNTTGKIKINVLYTVPELNTLLRAENVAPCGIKITGTVVRIIANFHGTGDGQGNPIYIDNDKIDLRFNGDYISFDEGFSLRRNFTIKLWLEEPHLNKILFLLKGVNGEIYLKYKPIQERFYIYKKIANTGVVSRYYSNIVSRDANKYFVCIKQVDSNLNIYAEENDI